MKDRNRRGGDVISTADRLGEYVVTQPPAGSRGTGLPAPRPRDDELALLAAVDASTEVPAGLHVVEEKRGEPRRPAVLRVHTSHPGAERGIEGVTVNVSPGGMCLEMPEPPPAAHQDVEVDDGDARSLVWAQVLSYDELSAETYHWHVRVTAADPVWEELIAAVDEDASLAVTGGRTEPARRVRPA